MNDPLRRWTAQLEGWAVPADILAQAPESPWGFLPGMFVIAEDEPVDSSARRLALEGLDERGDVLDVGCGGGSASLALVPPAVMVTGVDERAEALAAFGAACVARGVRHRGVVGPWPEVADDVEPAGVAVCHHVLYNVQDPSAFLAGLTDHARHRVVLEVNVAHPLTYLRPLWARFWGLDRPVGPTAVDAVSVVSHLGLEPEVVVDRRAPGHWRSPDQQVRLARKRLCLPAERDGEVAAALAELPPAPDEVWVLTWAGSAGP